MGVCSSFADLLSYPCRDVLARADACVAAVAASDGGRAAVSDLHAFRDVAARIGVPRLEEAYTAAFDLDPACSLSVGHHVFGENARRSLFMCRLAEMYRECGLASPEAELPDHLPVILRYLDTGTGGRAADDLLVDAVLPALGRVLEALERMDHPYAPVARALLAHLAASETEVRSQGTPV